MFTGRSCTKAPNDAINLLIKLILLETVNKHGRIDDDEFANAIYATNDVKISNSQFLKLSNDFSLTHPTHSEFGTFPFFKFGMCIGVAGSANSEKFSIK